MKVTKNFRIAVMLAGYLVLACFVASAPVSAVTTTIYNYTGNAFNQFSNATNPPYTSITGRFEVSSPLGNNLTFTDVSYLTGWVFTDGQNTFSADLGATMVSLVVSTSSTGNIVTPWHIEIFSDLGFYYVVLQSTYPPSASMPKMDISSFYDPLANVGGNAKVENSAGKWSISYRSIVPGSSPIPEPASMLLLTAGLATLWAFSRKRRFKGKTSVKEQDGNELAQRGC